MKFRDTYRGLYFSDCLEKELHKIESQLNVVPLFRMDSEVLHHFTTGLCEEIDQILLPTVVYEVHKAKKQEKLSGMTPQERYISFFLAVNGYTEQALALPKQYPFLFEMIDETIKNGVENLKTCLIQLNEDLEEIRSLFEIPSKNLIQSINILSASDRHRNKQSLLITFEDNIKIIYKPVNLIPDQLFRQIVEQMDCPEPYNLSCIQVIAKEGYGWIRYITPRPCVTREEVETFYCRFGVMLAFTNVLNYTDGHCENVLADGSFPILLDGETFFQNYDPLVEKYKNIFSTLLIERKDKRRKNRVYHSALQSSRASRFESLCTHAIDDHTDNIHVSFSGTGIFLNIHRPCIDSVFFNSKDFIDQVIDGYCFGYTRITERKSDILSNREWWQRVAETSTRIVSRETSTYLYLIRMIQQPELCFSKQKAREFLIRKLSPSPYLHYEVEDILNINVPYFYQYPGERNLYDGDNRCYRNVFPSTAINRIMYKLTNLSKKQMSKDCALLQRQGVFIKKI